MGNWQWDWKNKIEINWQWDLQLNEIEKWDLKLNEITDMEKQTTDNKQNKLEEVFFSREFAFTWCRFNYEIAKTDLSKKKRLEVANALLDNYFNDTEPPQFTKTQKEIYDKTITEINKHKQKINY